MSSEKEAGVLLAIDTSSQVMSLALHDGRQIVYEATWRTRNNHTTELTPTIETALEQAAIKASDLAAVAVAQGPGSFTGLRIGLGVAKGLAEAQQLPLIAIPSLDIVAAAVPAFNGPLVAVLQAGRGRVCAQRYRWARDVWVVDGDASITTWLALVESVEQETIFAGEIDEAGYGLLNETGRPARCVPGAFSLRRAGFLAELAWARFAAGDTDDPATVTPIYLNQPGEPRS